ncbi:exodeoxyribonuclease VII small subunit [Campylobacter blaseri]|uniref:Exodeoxyribonuclease VII small subunit n=1 Tax=Campylobacter blaseri TaxID=2042961 RepID=A0A2P8R0I0_9BACT|nr:exodeoxyribonuclease VII small subunit [Campylobacter blaseri]PSM52006.1 exodeoxyribonuclease VII small subunit [Campylobacter blaseri]PSM53791.1 exodeoxyribonuclease VII small subunit [Campylobacter blaseri]
MRVEKIDSFEDKIEKINLLLERLKDENLSLDESVKLYKDGMGILKEAKNILENAKLEIIEIEKEDE